jgi:hypothetical protein
MFNKLNAFYTIALACLSLEDIDNLLLNTNNNEFSPYIKKKQDKRKNWRVQAKKRLRQIRYDINIKEF